ncbi:hypothetical protein Peur_032607 [Populus x canadensis]
MKLARNVCTKAALSEMKYPKVAASSTGPIPPSQLIQVVETAAKTGAEVVMDAVNKPRNITYKGLTDLVTDTDKMSEAAILEVVRRNFGDHLILGEEGGIIGDTLSDYLWCIDPLVIAFQNSVLIINYAIINSIMISSFSGHMEQQILLMVILALRFLWEFFFKEILRLLRWWSLLVVLWLGTRTFSATAGGGAFCNGQKIHASPTAQVEQSLLVTGFGYEHDDPWATNIELFKEFTDVSRGVRRLGAAAVDMCHVALGIVEAYWEYRLKPWDMAAGVLIVEEAGGTVSRMDGGKFCVFDRSVLVSDGVLHAKMIDLIVFIMQLLERIAPATEKLKSK